MKTIYTIDTTDCYIGTWGAEACEYSCYIEVSCEPYNSGFLYDVDVCDPSMGHRTVQRETREAAEREVKWHLNLLGIDAEVEFSAEMERYGGKESCAVVFRERGILKREIVQRVPYVCGDARYIKWRGWWLELDADNIAEL